MDNRKTISAVILTYNVEGLIKECLSSLVWVAETRAKRAYFLKGNEYLIQQSIKRYNFAKEYCEGRKVLDIGSGEGYGSYIISKVANLTVAVDCDFEVVRNARDKYKGRNLYFLCADCNNLPFRNSYFDITISFELIEHLDSPYIYLSEISRTILKEGIYIGSTPQICSKELDRNPFHKHPYNREEYRDVLSKYFLSVNILGEMDVRKISKLHLSLRHLDILNLRNKLKIQFLRRIIARLLGSTPFEEVTQKDFIIDAEHIGDASILISVAQNPKK